MRALPASPPTLQIVAKRPRWAGEGKKGALQPCWRSSTGPCPCPLRSLASTGTAISSVLPPGRWTPGWPQKGVIRMEDGCEEAASNSWNRIRTQRLKGTSPSSPPRPVPAPNSEKLDLGGPPQSQDSLSSVPPPSLGTPTITPRHRAQGCRVACKRPAFRPEQCGRARPRAGCGPPVSRPWQEVAGTIQKV